MASFKQAEILAGYYELNQKAISLFDFVQRQRKRPLDFTDFVEIQEAFLKERYCLLERIIVEMKFLSWREHRALRERPLKTPPDPGGCRR